MKTYLAIDLKSFYASVECAQRGLDPLRTNLVVADRERTSKTICLAVSPALKQWGVPGRPRLFEVEERVAQINALRARNAPGGLVGKCWDGELLAHDPRLALDYIIAPPQMARYMEVSAQVYRTYLDYVAPEDIHVYSIDEVFIDATPYLDTYRLNPHDFATKLVRSVLDKTGITATAGIGTNLYLAKVAMDIVAKHQPPDQYGVRVARLDEESYRRTLWNHAPITDFWRVGRGTARTLERYGVKTMGQLARRSLQDEGLLYRLFGVNAELLIDHAWGWESCTLADIKAYRPEHNSLGSGQVLSQPYSVPKARIVVREMAEALALDLLDKGLVTDRLVLTVGYDRESLRGYRGEVTTDYYGRQVPKHAHGTQLLPSSTSSARILLEGVCALFDRIVDPNLLVRRLNLVAGRVVPEGTDCGEQLDLFAAPKPPGEERERRRQQAVLAIRKKYGKNAILKGFNFEEGATARQRNGQIGGHKA